MVDAIHSFLLRRTEEAARERASYWKRDCRSAEAYERSVAPNRDHLRRIVGAIDPRVDVPRLEVIDTAPGKARAAKGTGYTVYAARWPVLEPVTADFGGLETEGLLLEPDSEPAGRVVAIPDADWSPEMLVGLAPGVPEAAQFARRLAENGCQVLVPVVINRSDDWSGIEEFEMTHQPHPEWIYRMAFEVGRHIMGFEVQKVLAAIDWFTHETAKQPAPLGVIGYGEGGLLALYSAAIDLKIEAAVVSGYFQSRQELWKEPIYRDVWALLREFGDAELASLIAPRALIVEATAGPEVDGPPPATEYHKGSACPNGKLISPPLNSVQEEVERARPFFAALKAQDKLKLVVSHGGRGLPGSEGALRGFLRSLGLNSRLKTAARPPLVLKRDNGSNLNHQAVDEVLARYLVIPLNSPPHYPPYNGGMECAVRELKTLLVKKILASSPVPESQVQVWAEVWAHELNHRSRGCLHGQVACEVFQDAKPALKAYTLRKRKETFDWINELTMTLIQVWAVHTQR